MENLINNYINGNISDAKRLARRFKSWQIREGFQELAGYSERKASLTADFLKGRDCWQAACDAD